MQKKILYLLLLLVVLIVGAFVASGFFGVNIPIVSDLIAKIIPAESFISNQDGYRFKNYAGSYPEGNLTLEDAREMFGDVVCTRLEGDECITHPKVINWIDGINKEMNQGGHCVGFTVSSTQFFTDVRPVSELGADMTYALKPELPVLRTISQAHASTYAANVYAQVVDEKTPSEIIEALLDLNEPVDIGIFYPKFPQNGHSVLGHTVLDQGDGIYHILVYDSNYPGEDNVIVVDTKADTWFYAGGAVNPDQASVDYRGDAETKSLTFIPISAYNQPLSCAYEFKELCAATSDEQSFSVLNIFSRGQVLAETEDGQIGQVGETFVNTIPGGKFIPVRGELYSRQPPVMLIPSQEAFTLQAQSNLENDPLDITVSNPDYTITIDGLVGQPGQIEQLTFDPIAQEASFVAGGTQRPSIQFIFNQDGAVYSAQLIGVEFEAGQDLTVTVDAAGGDLQLKSNTLNVDDIVIMVARLTTTGETVFASKDGAITAGASLALDLDSWDGTGSMAILIDSDGDGTYESTTPLTNEPIADVLTGIKTAVATIGSLQNFVPYLDNQQIGEVGNALPALGFTGVNLGQAYLEIPDLRPNDLATSIGDLNLTLEELGAMIVEMHLDEEEITELLDDLRLTIDERFIVDLVIKGRQTLLDLLADWEFLNADDPSQLSTFLADKGLTPEMVDEFMTLISPEDEGAPLQPAVDTAVVCSTDGGTEVDITFANATSEPVTVYWVNSECNVELHAVVAPGESNTGFSFIGHAFVARNEAGQMLTLDAPNGLDTTFVVQTTGSVTVTVR